MLWKYLLRPFLFCFPPEFVHELTMGGYSTIAKLPLVDRCLRSMFAYSDTRLSTECFGIRFENCVGLAAGFDKNARWFNELSHLGFGHIEVGTLTGQAQTGNEKPRLFRISDDIALINRMGFNNRGSEYTAERLSRTKKKCVLGINIGKTKVVELENAVEDYLLSFERLYKYADYFTLNVSSPNTPNLRQLQDRDKLFELVSAVQQKNRELASSGSCAQRPVLLKIAPDLTESAIDEIAELAVELQIDAIIATNTTISRDNLNTNASKLEQIGTGGVSGKPLTQVSRKAVARLYQRCQGKLPIVGVGGIMNGEDAWHMITHGASLVQLYTGFIYGGPSTVKSVLKYLTVKLDELGLNSIENAVGRDLN